MKKLISVLLCVFLLIGILPSTALAAEEEQIGELSLEQLREIAIEQHDAARLQSAMMRKELSKKQGKPERVRPPVRTPEIPDPDSPETDFTTAALKTDAQLLQEFINAIPVNGIGNITRSYDLVGKVKVTIPAGKTLKIPDDADFCIVVFGHASIDVKGSLVVGVETYEDDSTWSNLGLYNFQHTGYGSLVSFFPGSSFKVGDTQYVGGTDPIFTVNKGKLCWTSHGYYDSGEWESESYVKVIVINDGNNAADVTLNSGKTMNIGGEDSGFDVMRPDELIVERYSGTGEKENEFKVAGTLGISEEWGLLDIYPSAKVSVKSGGKIDVQDLAIVVARNLYIEDGGTLNIGQYGVLELFELVNTDGTVTFADGAKIESWFGVMIGVYNDLRAAGLDWVWYEGIERIAGVVYKYNGTKWERTQAFGQEAYVDLYENVNGHPNFKAPTATQISATKKKVGADQWEWLTQDERDAIAYLDANAVMKWNTYKIGKKTYYYADVFSATGRVTMASLLHNAYKKAGVPITLAPLPDDCYWGGRTSAEKIAIRAVLGTGDIPAMKAYYDDYWDEWEFGVLETVASEAKFQGAYEGNYLDYIIPKFAKIVEMPDVTGVAISNKILAISKDKGTLQMTKTITPAKANQNVIWEITESKNSDNAVDPNVASISASGLLTAKKNGEVKVKVTSVNGKDGATLTDTKAVTVSGQSSYGSLYGPRLSATTLTINKKMNEGALLKYYFLAGDDFGDDLFCELVGANKDKFELSEDDGPTIWVSLTEDGSTAKPGKYAVTLILKTQFDPKGYNYPLTITIVDTKPVVTVKAPTVNLFYTDAEYTIGLTSKSGAVSLLAIEDNAKTPGFKNSFELIGGKLKLKADVTSPVKVGVLKVGVEGFAPQTVPITVKTATTAPKYAANPAIYTINKAEVKDKDTLTFAVNNTGVKPAALLKIKTATQAVDDDKYSVKAHDGKIELTLHKDKIEDFTGQAIAAKLNITAEGWASAKPLTVTVNLATAAPTVKYSATSLKLNSEVSGEKFSISLTPSQSNVSVVSVVVEKADTKTSGITGTFAGGKVTFTTDSTTANSAYKFKLTPYFSNSAEGTPQIVTVTVISSVATLAATAKGTINYLNPNSAVMITLKLANTVDKIDEVKLVGTDADKFDFHFATGKLTLKPKAVGTYTKGQTFSVAFEATLVGGEKLTTKAITIKPVQTLPKVTIAPAKPMFYAGVSHVYNIADVNITPSFGALTTVTPIVNNNPVNLTVVWESGRFVAKLNDSAGVKTKAGTYVFSFNVTYAHQANEAATKKVPASVKPVVVKVTCVVK